MRSLLCGVALVIDTAWAWPGLETRYTGSLCILQDWSPQKNSREQSHTHHILLPHEAIYAFNVEVYLLVQLVGTRHIVTQDKLQLQAAAEQQGSHTGWSTPAYRRCFQTPLVHIVLRRGTIVCKNGSTDKMAAASTSSSAQMHGCRGSWRRLLFLCYA